MSTNPPATHRTRPSHRNRTKTHTLTLLLIMITMCAFATAQASARQSRELVTSFGSLENITGLAVDQETGNVYVADNQTQGVYIFGPNGGPPVDGVPSKIDGVHIYPSLGALSGIAVDNSCYEHRPRLTGVACEEYDPSYRDVYVVEDKFAGAVRPGSVLKYKFNASQHLYEQAAELTPTINKAAKIVEGIAIDPKGNVYTVDEYGAVLPEPVYEFRKIVEKVSNGGSEEITEHLEQYELRESITSQGSYVAAAAGGYVYVGSRIEGLFEQSRGVARLATDEMGGVLSESNLIGEFHQSTERPIAIDWVTGAVFVGDQSQAEEYSASGVLQLTFGSEDPLGGSLGKRLNGVKAIAVDGERERIYVANALHHDIDVFGAVVSPPVIAPEQPAVSAVTRTTALLAGVATPESSGANYYFQYVPGEEYEPGAGDPYVQGARTAVTPLTGGNSPQTVEGVALTGLRPGVTYHYRMVVSNSSATEYGPDETFTTLPSTPPGVSTGSVLTVSATGATLTGVVMPRGLSTSYEFEIGSDTTYSGAKLFGDAGSGTGEMPVSVALQYLTPGATYHYRLTATSFDGTTYGQDGTFTTPASTVSLIQPASPMLLPVPAISPPRTAVHPKGPSSRCKRGLKRDKHGRCLGRAKKPAHRKKRRG